MQLDGLIYQKTALPGDAFFLMRRYCGRAGLRGREIGRQRRLDRRLREWRKCGEPERAGGRVENSGGAPAAGHRFQGRGALRERAGTW